MLAEIIRDGLFKTYSRLHYPFQPRAGGRRTAAQMAGVTVWAGEELSEVLFFQANAAESDGLFIDYSLVVSTGP